MNVIKYDDKRQHFAKILIKSKKHEQKDASGQYKVRLAKLI